MSSTAWCRVGDIQDVTGPEWLLGSWALAAALALLLVATGRRRGRTKWESVGFAVMTVPVWMVLLATAPDMVRTFCAQGDVVAVTNLHPRPPEPYSTFDLSRHYIDAILRNLGYVALGAILVVHGRIPGWWRRPTVRAMSEALRGLLPMRRGEMSSLRAGVSLFPLLALGNLGLLAVTGTPVETAGRGPLYAGMTAFHAAILALAAGVGEELVFRGVMQQGLIATLRRIAPRMPQRGAAAIAVPLVAVPFAYSHADYGNPPLLLFAFLFSVIASVAALWLGIWAAIALHALIDFYAFFVSVPQPDAALWTVAAVVSVAVVAVAAGEAFGIQRKARPHQG
ncbi:MAG: lysostaphin resistance A-like protein [Thermoplasmatota archaeon]